MSADSNARKALRCADRHCPSALMTHCHKATENGALIPRHAYVSINDIRIWGFAQKYCYRWYMQLVYWYKNTVTGDTCNWYTSYCTNLAYTHDIIVAFMLPQVNSIRKFITPTFPSWRVGIICPHVTVQQYLLFGGNSRAAYCNYIKSIEYLKVNLHCIRFSSVFLRFGFLKKYPLFYPYFYKSISALSRLL